jgi:hypothetical protein
MIPLNILEALLSSNGQHRQAAEAHLQSLDVNQRVFEWVSVWRELEQVQQQPNPANTALPHMIAVLWRRDILSCSTNVTSLLDPLQRIFASNTPVVADEKVRSALGYCLAEVVALVQTSAALEQTLQVTESLVSLNRGKYFAPTSYIRLISILSLSPSVHGTPWPSVGAVSSFGTCFTRGSVDTSGSNLDP